MVNLLEHLAPVGSMHNKLSVVTQEFALSGGQCHWSVSKLASQVSHFSSPPVYEKFVLRNATYHQVY